MTEKDEALRRIADAIGDDMLLNGFGPKVSSSTPVGFLTQSGDVDDWSRKGFPPVLFITYAYDDTDNAPVEDVSPTLERMRYWMRGRCGVVYRAERLPVETWSDKTKPEYGNEQFVETVGRPIK